MNFAGELQFDRWDHTKLRIFAAKFISFVIPIDVKIIMSYKTPNIKKIDPIEPPCRKTTYYSLEEAQTMANYIRENRTVKEIRVYNCLICGYWHLTSKTK